VQYGEQANGRQVDTKIHEEFEIDLPEVRTAGYKWTIVQNGGPVLQLLGDTSQPNTARVGSAGHHRWRLQAATTGASEIRLEYARPWNESAEPARTFTLKVRVES